MNQAMVLFEKKDDEGKKVQTKLRNQIVKVLHSNLPPDRFVALALREISDNQKLMQCTALSVCASIVEAAIMGLEIGSVLGQAYLVPFGRECQLIVGYKGLVLLAWRDARIITHADLIRTADTYDIIRGSKPEIIHKPALNVDRGDVVGAYAVFTYPDGRTVQVFHDLIELERRRLRSRAKDNGPWVTDKAAMQLKCPIRDGASKFIPFDTAPAMVTAAARDELRDVGVGGYVDPEVMQTAAEITGEDPSAPEQQALAAREEANKETNGKGVDGLKQRLAGCGKAPTITSEQAKKLDQMAMESGFQPLEWANSLAKNFDTAVSERLPLSKFEEAMKLAKGEGNL